MHRTLRFFITSIFLCAAFSASAQVGTDWELKAVEYERAAFSADEEGNIPKSSIPRLPRVQFHADGTLGRNDDIPIIDEATQKKYVIKVDSKGMVSMKAR